MVSPGDPGRDHDWVFLSVSVREHPHVVIVCSACGEGRFSEISEYGGDERRVDLSGDCPGRPRRREMYERTR